jgi:O-antigen/teichoic acid export membrane protein
MKRLSQRYREFHIFSALSILVSQASMEIPLLLIAFFFSSKIAGFYTLALRVVNMPMMLVGTAVSNVLLQKATEDPLKGEDLARDTIQLFGYLIYLSLPPVLILMIFGEILFGIVFGLEWREAGVFAQILSLSFLFAFLQRPLSVFFDAFERQKLSFVFTSLLLIMRGTTVIGGKYITNSIHIVLLSLVVITCVIYAISCFYLFGLLKVSARKILVVFLNKIAVLAPFIFGLFLLKLLLYKHNLMAAILSASLLILQGIIISVFEPQLKQKTVSFLSIFKLKFI